MAQPVDPQHPNDPVPLTDFMKEQRIEYNTYVATEDITLDNGARLANRGDIVLKSTAERLGWHEDSDHAAARVVKRDSAAGKKLLQELGRLPADEPKATAKATTTKAGSN